MPLPDNRELREMLEYASPYPWRQEWGYIVPNDEDTVWAVADVGAEYGRVKGLDADIDLILVAPQLAEEVIRLREEIDRLKSRCRDRALVADAEARLADNEWEKAWQRGRAEAYYDIYLQITQEQHKESQ